MKRFTALLLSLMIIFTACGAPESTVSTSEKSPAALLMEAAGFAPDAEISQIDVDADISLQEISLNDGTWSWVLGDTVDTAVMPLTDSTRYTTYYTRSGDHVLLRRCLLDGTIDTEYAIPMKQNEEGVGCFVIGADSVWLIHNYYQRVETEMSSDLIITKRTLEHWDQDGQQCSIPYEALFAEDAEIRPYDMALYENQLILSVSNALVFLDETGTIADTLPTAADYNTFCYDRDGSIYLRDGDSDAIYAFDPEAHTIGGVLFDTDFLEGVYPGSGPYDFFLCGDTIRGVNFSDRTITEFLTLSDYGLTDRVQNVLYMEDNQLVLGLLNAFTHETDYQTLCQARPEAVPEKTPLTLAYGMGEAMLSDGFTWHQTSGSLEEEIADFNLRSQYSIQVAEFSDVNALNISMAAGDIPDLICWSRNLADDAAMASYQRNGYLADLLEYMEQDPEIDPDDLLQNVRDAYTASDGGIYRLPTSMICFGLIGHSQFVGTQQGISAEKLYEIAQTLPEDTLVMDCTGSWFLKMMLQYTLGNYVDTEKGTCNFDTEEFRSLMYLARDYLPLDSEYDPSARSDTLGTLEGLISGEVLLQHANLINGVEFSGGEYRTYEAAGVTMVGYPGLGGNGTVATPSTCFSICASGTHPDGAWAFLRNYFTCEAQCSGAGMVTLPVMESALRDSQKALQSYYGYTDADYALGVDLVVNAMVPKLTDDTILNIILEEADPFLTGDKAFEDVISLMESRIIIYLSEQS